MRNNAHYLLTLLVFFAVAGSCPVFAGGGGPDAYGYSWIDSNEPGLSFSWVDITGRPGATRVDGLGDDGNTSFLPIGFPFQYYWRVEDRIRVGANGWLSFDPGSKGNSWCFQTMPEQLQGATNSTLAPFLTDLSFETKNANFPNIGEMWIWSNEQDSFVVSYIHVPWWRDDSMGTQPPDWVGDNTFQIILSGQDSSITFQYLSMSDTAFLDRPECGSEIVVGIENNQGLIGLQPILETVPPDSFAIRFHPPTVDSVVVRDAYAEWSMRPGSKGQFYLRDSNLVVTGAIGNAGNADVDTMVVVEARLRTQSMATIWLSRDTLDSVPLGPPQIVTFTDMPSLPNLAQYNLSIEAKQPGDQNNSNDVIAAELGCIPDTGLYFPLRYTYNTATSSSLSWPSGNNGAGIYMDFPFGPIRILSADVYIIGNDPDTLTPLLSGFLLQVYADSMGHPGPQLANEAIPSWAARDEWNAIPFANQPVIDSGGFYISWIQGGPGIGLGTETTGPVSRNTFEIINGKWAPYRFAGNEDFMIEVNIERLLPDGRTAATLPFAGVQLFPNPARGQVQLRYRLKAPEPVRVTVSDLFGRAVWESDFAINAAGLRNLSLDLGDVPAGMYHVTLSARSGSTSQKLILVD